MTKHIYIDLVFVLNSLMNYLILRITAHIYGARFQGKRPVLAAGLGGLYAVAHRIDSSGVLSSPAAKLLFGTLMAVIAFGSNSGWRALRLCGSFFSAAFCVAGAAFALHYALLGSWALPLLGIGLSLVGLGAAVIRLESVTTSAQSFSITVTVDGRTVVLDALFDTGNRLKEPISGMPVIIAELDALEALMSHSLMTAIAENARCERAANDIADNIADTSWAARLRALPYESVGVPHGLLLGFKPDCVAYACGQGPQKRVSAIIGMACGRLSADGRHNALVGPAALLERWSK